MQESNMQDLSSSAAALHRCGLTSTSLKMKTIKLGVIVSTLFFAVHFSFAQTTFYGTMLDNQGVFMGGMGLAAIGGETFYTINLRPELALGKFGFGLDIPLRYNTQTGHIRSEDWNDDYDYFRTLRYLRYGHKKRDKFYTRVGALDATRLGHGFIMNYYNNSLLYDERKIGLELDTDFGFGGFELMTSNFERREIFGGRLYYRPLQLVTNTPIIRNFAIGATYILDDDPDGKRGTGDSVSEFGLDAELPIIQTELTRLALYGDLAKITDFGSGQAAGVDFQLHGIDGAFEFGAQLERRFLGKQFLPAYFGPFYELERHNVQQNGKAFPKRDSILAKQKEARGTFGMLYGLVLNTLRLVGTYERRDGIPNSGILHVEANVPETIPKIAVRAMYDHKGIETFGDVVEFKDDNASARIGVGYKLNQFLIFYADYIYTFERQPDGSTKVQKRFEPQLALAVTFPVGGK
jgi:hypothetical protein